MHNITPLSPQMPITWISSKIWHSIRNPTQLLSRSLSCCIPCLMRMCMIHQYLCLLLILCSLELCMWVFRWNQDNLRICLPPMMISRMSGHRFLFERFQHLQVRQPWLRILQIEFFTKHIRVWYFWVHICHHHGKDYPWYRDYSQSASLISILLVKQIEASSSFSPH